MDMGKHAADNILKSIRGGRLQDFKPSGNPLLVSFGDLDSYLIADQRVMAAPGLALAKELVYQIVMNKFADKGRLTRVPHIIERMGLSAQQIFVTQFRSLEALKQIPNLRFL